MAMAAETKRTASVRLNNNESYLCAGFTPSQNHGA
jgi:hypothetical protein